MKLLHLSDSHFGTVYPAVKTALDEAVAAAAPDVVVLSGDVTQRARASQFRAARAFLETLPVPTLVVPGNHDLPLFALPLRLLVPRRGFTSVLGRAPESLLHVRSMAVWGLDSTSRWRHVQGALHARSLREKVRWPAEARFRVAAIHHPLDCRRAEDEKNLLRGAAQVTAELARERVDLVLSGHVHDPYVATSSVRHLFPHRSFVVSVAGTCSSWRTRVDAPNSFHAIELRDETMTIVRHDFDGKAFVPHAGGSKTFLREAGGWTKRG